jgi:hypothetical protein
MDAVVEDALRAVARAESALAAAEQALRQAWAERLAAFGAAGWKVVYAHDILGTPPSQRLVVEDGAGAVVDIDHLAAVVAAGDR